MHIATYKLEHLHLHLHLHLQESCIDKHAMEIRDLAVPHICEVKVSVHGCVNGEAKFIRQFGGKKVYLYT